MFVGRGRELALLEEMYERQVAALVVCRGRRRIGKSRLIQEFGRRVGVFFEFQGLAPNQRLSETSQLENFSQQLAHQFGLPSSLRLNNWTEAFALLASQVRDKKAVILLDEISWMGSKEKEFSGILKIAWDTLFKKNTQLVLVLCGSVSSWIDDNILRDSGFVGRVSLTLSLEELSLSTCNKFWSGQKDRVSSFEKLKFLSITGGVPRYLEEIRPRVPVETTIRRLCFEKEGMLFTEFDKIFNDMFNRRGETYKQIILSLVSGPKSVFAICDALKREQSGVMSGYLYDLELSGFIARDYAWTFAGRRTKLNRYRLRDNYLRFYLKYIEPMKDKIKKGLYEFKSLETLSEWNIIVGLQFENLVLNNLPTICCALKLSPELVLNAGPYFQKKTQRKEACQIDLLIQTNTTLYVCEVKYRKKVGMEVVREVEQKIRKLKTPRNFSVRPVLIFEGQLTEDLSKSDYFDRKICFGDLLS